MENMIDLKKNNVTYTLEIERLRENITSIEIIEVDAINQLHGSIHVIYCGCLIFVKINIF